MSWARILGVLSVLFFSLDGSFVIAQEEIFDTTKVYSLGEIVVSDNRVGSQVNVKLEVDSDEIEKRNAKTLDKALMLLPGIIASKGAAGVPRINIRGFRCRHTTLLLNGVPINSTYDGQFDPNIIPTDNISKIKISYGTQSVLYGQGGLAGVINIITKQGTTGFGLKASAEMDERGNNYTKANLSGGKDRFDYFISATNKNSDGFLLPSDFSTTTQEDGGVRENSDDKQLSFFGNLGFTLNNEIKMGLTVESSNGEYGIPATVVDDKSDPFYKSPKYERVDDFKTFSSQATLNYDPEGVFGLRAWGFVNNAEEDRARYDDDSYNTMTNRNSYKSNAETTIKGGTIQASLNLDNVGETVFSFSGQKDSYTSTGEKVLVNNTPAVPFNLNHDLNLYSAALEYKVGLLSNLDLVLGYSHHLQSKDSGNDDDKASYMAGTSLNLFKGTILRASYARKIRFPSIRQLYDIDTGNTALLPEQSDNHELGINQKLFWNMVLDLSVFLNDVENYIEKDEITDRFENNEEYRFKGVEATLGRKILENGNVRIGYSYLDSEDRSDTSQKDELHYRPKHKFTIDTSYSWDFGLTVHCDFMHVADQYYYSSSYQKGKLNDFSIVNFKVEQQLNGDNLSLYLGADNLFDELYEESYGYPQTGRTVYAGLRMKF